MIHNLEAWRRLKRDGGPDWNRAVAVDDAIRHKRPKHDLFIHPYRLPLAEAVRIPEDEGARQTSFSEIPCDGGACFT